MQCLASGVSDTDTALGPNLSGLPKTRGATRDSLWRKHIQKDLKDKRLAQAFSDLTRPSSLKDKQATKWVVVQLTFNWKW